MEDLAVRPLDMEVIVVAFTAMAVDSGAERLGFKT